MSFSALHCCVLYNAHYCTLVLVLVQAGAMPCHVLHCNSLQSIVLRLRAARSALPLGAAARRARLGGAAAAGDRHRLVPRLHARRDRRCATASPLHSAPLLSSVLRSARLHSTPLGPIVHYCLTALSIESCFVMLLRPTLTRAALLPPSPSPPLSRMCVRPKLWNAS